MNTDNNVVDNKDNRIDEQIPNHINSIDDIYKLNNISDRKLLSDKLKEFNYIFVDKLYDINK